MGTLFWIFTLPGCAVLVAIWLLTLEGEDKRQRKLKKIQKRLEQIESAATADEEKRNGNA